MGTRVFELARELGVRSKDILEKCQAEGIELKNHMASLSAGLQETIREWFSESEGEHTAVETAEHVDLEEARARAAKSRRRRSGEEEADAESVTEEVEEAATEETESAPEEEAPETLTEEEPEETVEPEVVVEEPEPAVEPVAEEEAPQEEVVAEAEPQEEEAEPEAEAETSEPEAEAEKPEEVEIKPAGPQVVPKPAKLKGPQVIRVERPDYAPRPAPRQAEGGGAGPRTGGGGPRRMTASDEPPRRGGPGGGGPGGPGGPGARRTPRRKLPRSNHSDAREKLKEWRNKDLLERAERIAGAATSLRRRRPAVSNVGNRSVGPANTGTVEIEEPITVKSLSAATGLKSAEIIRKLMGMGVMATVNQVINTEQAETIMAEYNVELKIARLKTAEEELLERLDAREKAEITNRAPVVTFLGHVDHGKTSLLDYIRKTTVASGEAGGITQAIGAYRHDLGDQHVTFLDTPGHEAFTAMRARGANMTDVVVLVVAADDGVMPQTIEAINHAKAAGVPIVVALNKVDVPNANIQKALAQLAEHGLQPREWGGETEVVQTSAITGQGMDDLIELLSLEAEILELNAEVDAPANGYVVESRMDPGLGPVATLLIINGTLKVGDPLLAGRSHGYVRQILSDKGDPIESAGPSLPVLVSGLDDVAEAGDKFYIVADIDEARKVAEQRRNEDRAKSLAATAGQPRSLEDLLGKIGEGEINEIPVILKADVQGSVEALLGTLTKVGSDEAKLNILHAGVGGITTGDVTLAEASSAVIIGFNVVADAQARKLAEQTHVEVRTYRVIYDIIEDMRRALEEGLAPEIREETLGQAEVRQIFKISRLGTIAGCYVTDGTINRNAKVRVIRNNVVIEDERSLDSLKRVKDDVREVRSGLECGLKLAGYDDIKEGDILEFYQNVEVARTL